MFGRSQPPPGTGLQICPVCRADFVVPVWWEELEDRRMRLLLRCGECDTHHDLVVAGEVADRFEKDYLRVLEGMAATLDRLDRERMAAEASAGATAHARDLIDADHFGLRGWAPRAASAPRSPTRSDRSAALPRSGSTG